MRDRLQEILVESPNFIDRYYSQIIVMFRAGLNCMTPNASRSPSLYICTIRCYVRPDCVNRDVLPSFFVVDDVGFL